MKSFALLLLVGTALGVMSFTEVCGQTTETPSYVPYYHNGYYGGYYARASYHHASTAAEGYLRGMGDVIRSQAEANLHNSVAAMNYAQARRTEIANRRARTEAYFQRQQANKAYRAAKRGPSPTAEDIARYSRLRMPKPLAPNQFNATTGELQWPVALMGEDFTDDRSRIQQALVQSASGTLAGIYDRETVQKTTQQMLAKLKGKIHDVPPQEYMTAKRFLESLAYEARQLAA